MSLVALRNDLSDPDDVLAGLRAPHKQLPCRLLYADAGAELFEKICTLDAYYPTRSELALLGQHLPQIAHHVGPHARVIEPGSGEGKKTRMLLQSLDAPSGYVPIDVAHDQLQRLAAGLRRDFPAVDIAPVTADYTAPFELPVPGHAFKRTLVFFPGSTIGNFEPDDARRFLARLATLAGPDRMLLVGADATRDAEVLLRAYDDEHGVTAAFNKNALAVLNRARDATFDLDAFHHRAVWNAAASRVEMHLVSKRRQVVRVGAAEVTFVADEPIVTEHCYKHTPAAMHALLASAGWRPRQVFTASPMPFRLWLCEPAAAIRV
ncbi:MAG TPA: L-histidine N(alpha)-methyltransferase [Kofleriaceae bacterium]|nr:L-histidine N(alpha)-methyltransferase [Kofleriaceae bacterium]